MTSNSDKAELFIYIVTASPLSEIKMREVIIKMIKRLDILMPNLTMAHLCEVSTSQGAGFRAADWKSRSTYCSWLGSPSSSVLLEVQDSGSVPITVPPCGEYSETSGRREGEGAVALVPAP